MNQNKHFVLQKVPSKRTHEGLYCFSKVPISLDFVRMEVITSFLYMPLMENPSMSTSSPSHGKYERIHYMIDSSGGKNRLAHYAGTKAAPVATHHFKSALIKMLYWVSFILTTNERSSILLRFQNSIQPMLLLLANSWLLLYIWHE